MFDVGLPAAVPFQATISSFDAADAIGRVVAEGGAELRFGRSACKGFEPVVGARVLVHSVDPHPLGGVRASELRLPEGDTSYDQLLAERDRALGVRPSRGGLAAVQQARALGWITLLMDEPVPTGVQALKAWAAKLNLEAAGITVSCEDGLRLGFGGFEMPATTGDTPFPREAMDLRSVGEDFSPGGGFLTLSLGDPGLHRKLRILRKRDDWAPDGQLRSLSQLAAALAPHCRGVVLNRAGELTLPRDAFLRRLGNLADPDCVPFGAWLDFATTPGPSPEYRTFGMSAFGFPDVRAPFEAGSAWQRSRRHEALLFSCYLMVRENRDLRVGEVLRVPVGVRIGAYSLRALQGDADSYRVAQDPGTLELVLEPVGQPVDPAACWAKACAQGEGDADAMAPNTYCALFRTCVDETLPGALMVGYPSEDPGRLPHALDVRSQEPGQGYCLLTNGFGRVIQTSGVQAGVPHIELMAQVSLFSPELLDELEAISVGIDGREPGASAWKVGDTVGYAIESRGIAGFVLANGGRVQMPGGSPVQLLQLVPLTASEYAEVRRGSGPWLAQHMRDPARQAELRMRWNGPVA